MVFPPLLIFYLLSKYEGRRDQGKKSLSSLEIIAPYEPWVWIYKVAISNTSAKKQ